MHICMHIYLYSSARIKCIVGLRRWRRPVLWPQAKERAANVCRTCVTPRLRATVVDTFKSAVQRDKRAANTDESTPNGAVSKNLQIVPSNCSAWQNQLTGPSAGDALHARALPSEWIRGHTPARCTQSRPAPRPPPPTDWTARGASGGGGRAWVTPPSIPAEGGEEDTAAEHGREGEQAPRGGGRRLGRGPGRGRGRGGSHGSSLTSEGNASTHPLCVSSENQLVTTWGLRRGTGGG